MSSDAALRELYDKGYNDRTIGELAGRTKDQVRHWRARNRLPANDGTLRGEEVEQAYIASISEDDNWPLPVRPLQVNVPELSFERPARQTYVSIHYGDVHFPFHDPQALEVLYKITADLCPDLVVCHGDLLDCYNISRYEKDPKHRISLQDEMRMAGEHLGIMTSLSPFADRWLLLGNHEDRLRRLIWDMAQQLPARQLIELPNVFEQLEWGKLLGTDGIGWEVVDGKRVLFDKIILKHGTVVRKWSAYSARAEWERYAKSGISGHTHRRGVFETRDHNGIHAWFEHGCLCDTNPSYVDDPNWQQGFLVVTWSKDKDKFGVEEVRIHNGAAIFRGNLY